MNRRIAWILAFVCAAVSSIALAPLAAQTPVPTQAPARTVKAAIPPQAEPATAPAVASVPSLARPSTAPTPAVAPVAAAAPQPVTAPVPPQARPPVPSQATAPRAEPAPAPKPMSETEAANVKIEVTITYQVGNAAPVKRMATLTVADQGRGSLRSGNQVAVPSTTFQPVAAGGPPTSPVTSVTYKSVGLNVDANRVYITGNKARMDLNVEFSAVDEKGSDVAGKYPSFPTFSQSLTLVLESGKPIIVGQSSDVVENVERKQTVEVRATILR
jgi:hypothetical protein